MGKIVLSLQES